MPDHSILAERVAMLHAQEVLRILQSLPCPPEEKLALLEAVLADASPPK